MVAKEDFICLVPARIGSTRFPAKPLAEILGKPMIVWVMERVASHFGNEKAFCVTDSDEIQSVLALHGYSSILETGAHRTGTDRIAAVIDQFPNATRFFNVQGDEPALESHALKQFFFDSVASSAEVTNAYAEHDDALRFASPNSIKIVKSVRGHLLYASRAPIPYLEPFAGRAKSKYQVCMYSFTPKALRAFAQSMPVSDGIETAENIEILRFLEQGISVQMFLTLSSSHPVDIPSDIEIVEELLRQGPKSGI